MLVKVNYIQPTSSSLDIADDDIRNFFLKRGFNIDSDIYDCTDEESGYLDELVEEKIEVPVGQSWEFNEVSEYEFREHVKNVLSALQTEMRQQRYKKVIEEFLHNHFDKIRIYDKSDFIDYRINKSDIESLLEKE